MGIIEFLIIFLVGLWLIGLVAKIGGSIIWLLLFLALVLYVIKITKKGE